MGPLLALLAALLAPMDASPDDTGRGAPNDAVVETVAYAAPQPDEADAKGQPEPERWTGAVELPGAELGITITIAAESDLPDAAWTGSIDIPMQGVDDLPLSDITRTGSTLAFTAPLPGMPESAWPRWSLTIAEGGAAEGVLRQSGGEFPTTLRLAREGESLGPPRPQQPRPPFPYRTEEVTIETEMGHTLAGTLVLPDPAAFEPPYPTAVLITGSGPQDRDETLLGHKPFAVLADHLARRGIASLRCDDRGFAGSTGDFASATTLDFVEDARAQVAFLADRDEVASIGLIGHSEGGLVAPFVAAENGEVDWLVLLAGTGVPGSEVLIEQSAAIQLAGGADEAWVREHAAAQRRVFDAVLADDLDAAEPAMRELIRMQTAANGIEADDAMLDSMTAQHMHGLTGQPWMRTFLTLDPRPALAKVTQPVLVLNGELDLQVLPDQNVPAIEAALEHNDDVEVRILPGLNHLFQPAETGSPGEYAEIEITFDPGALEIISGWIQRR